MNAGQLNKKIIIQKNQSSKNDYGESVSSWVDYVTLWANIKHLRGQELFLSEQVYNKEVFRIQTRYYSGIDTKMRISYDSKIFNITSINNINEKNITLEFIVEELGND